jgi:DNA modification methylase
VESFLDGKVTLHRGDCLEVLPLLEANSIDSCVCDPPYHLTSIVKRFGQPNSAPPKEYEEYAHKGRNPYKRTSTGFMGKQWDGGDIAFRPETWAEVLRVLKPGAHLIAFSGTRTYHRMACAIEDAGFEIRDQIGWCYGSGFPKSHDVSKGIDRLAGAQREVVGTKRIDASAIYSNTGAIRCGICGNSRNGTSCTCELPRPTTESAIQWQGWGTALKPAWEPIVLARKPLSESSIAANVLKHGTGGINVDGCRVGPPTDTRRSKGLNPSASGAFPHSDDNWTPRLAEAGQCDQGRWPANLIHDGSEEVLAGFPDVVGRSDQNTSAYNPYGGNSFNKSATTFETQFQPGFNDSGSAARFFYTAKADANDRLGSKHPTVKPIDLMQYLVRLVTPKNGVVLDPFGGTGTTAEAAFRECVQSIIIEREEEYQADIVKRMGLCLSGPDERRAASVKQLPPDDLPMFGGFI